MIKQLNNPKSTNYFLLKQEILSDNFCWYWVNSTTEESPEKENLNGFKNHEYLSHCVLRRPNDSNIKSLFPTISSQYSKGKKKVYLPNKTYISLSENSIFAYNKSRLKVFY